METDGWEIEQARAAFDGRMWRDAYGHFTAARARGSLAAADLWRFALASFLIGKEEDFLQATQECHRAHVSEGDPALAARAAFWLGLHLANTGETAQASGWFGRAGRMLEQVVGECVERGYLLVPVGFGQMMSGEYESAAQTAGQAVSIAQAFGDGNLLALALHLQGRALLRTGRVNEGLALLDEAMVAVSTDELSPQVTGLIYCSVIGACREVWALRRAREWTTLLTDWCDRQPEMIAYTGECRVYRSEILRTQGDWSAALAEAEEATRRFDRGSVPDAAGLAHYQRAEIHRLRGDWAAAEEAYLTANREGYPPQPGLALLRLSLGEGDAAAASLRRALAENPAAARRSRLLPALVEVLLDIGDFENAEAACTELATLAGSMMANALDAALAAARGAIALAEGNADAALEPLRRAYRDWRALDAPWESARVRVLLARACQALGDADGARLELHAARDEFERLGAMPDVERVDALLDDRAPSGETHGLTPREREVLSLIATGMTNRAVAEKLSISEKTVERHAASIFRKIDVSSRAAATAFAYEHDLL